MSADAIQLLPDEQRREIGEQLGFVVLYFSNHAQEARRERDEAIARAERAEAILLRYRCDGVRVTDVRGEAPLGRKPHRSNR